jgi:hypothetical protein
MKSIFDPSFRYTPSYNTDLKKTFARLRVERRRAEQAGTAPAPGTNVTLLGSAQKKRGRAAGSATGGRR